MALNSVPGFASNKKILLLTVQFTFHCLPQMPNGKPLDPSRTEHSGDAGLCVLPYFYY